jgi:hypothetical protein
MKKKYFLILSLLVGWITTLQAEDFKMPVSYGDHTDKQVTAPFVFYDSGGATSNAEAAEMDYMTYEITNVYSGINFVAANAGEQVTLSFTSINIVRGDYIKIYDRALTADEKSNEFNAPTDQPIATISNSSTPITVTSTSGVLGVVYFEKQCSYDNNWEAQVKAFVPAPMQFSTSIVDQDELTTTSLGKEHQPLLRICIETTGALTPLRFTSLQYNLEGTTTTSDLAALRLYSTGNQATFSNAQMLAEKTNVSDTGEFTCNHTLLEGENYFWLAADISTTAIAQHLIDAACTSIQIGETTYTPTTTAPQGAITINSEVLIASTAKTYSVGDETVAFYDDGGQSGKISADFEGKVTFIPTTPGSKVQIDFTKLALFTTSSTGYNDVLKVYHGSEVNEVNLAATLLKTPSLIQSIADNGALTVTFKSTTGYPKDGFEANVSQFVPQAMQVLTHTVTMPTDAAVSSGNTDVEMLCLNLQTVGTEPALTLSQLQLNIPCFEHLEGVKVYYTAASSTFSTTTSLTSQTNLSQALLNLEINNQPLKQGDNYFWVTFDVKNSQPSGTVLDAGITAYTLSGNETTITDGDPTGERIIENKWISTLGTNECLISGTWNFTHTSNPYSSDKYKGEMGDQIVIFKPAKVGEVVQISFDDFEVKYSSSSYYGTRAKFEIRNGGIDGDILWQVDDTEKAKSGPQALIRSTAADGSLTVIFDAKTTSSYYCAAGWHAQVQSYKATNMALKEYTAFQNNTSIMMTGAKAQEILGVKVSMEGTLNPVKATQLVFDCKGKKALIEGAKVYFTHQSSAFEASASTLIGSVTALQDQTTISFDNEGVILAEGDNYFWLAYDLPDVGPAEVAYDAALVSMTIAENNNIVPVVADPEGERITKNIAVLQQGDNGIKTISGQLKFYDEGGVDGDYTRGVDAQITFKPATEGKVIKLVIHKMKLSYSDYFYAYDGHEVKTTADFSQKGSLDSDEVPLSLLSHAEDGSITVRLKSKSTSSSYTYEGWDIDVIEYTPLPLTLEQLAVTSEAPNEILKGMNNVAMLKLAVTVAGDAGALSLQQFTIATPEATSTAIAQSHLYYTGTRDIFSAHDEVAHSTTAPYQFNFSTQFNQAGTYYFWVAYDVNSAAAVQEKLTAKLIQYTSQNQSTTVNDAVIASTTVKAGFSGEYTIGSSSSADYTDFASAIAAMQDGIDGPVVFTIEAGTYSRVSIPAIQGASSTNTITFKGTGNPDDVRFVSNEDVNEDQGIFEIAGADYLTIDGISILDVNYGWKAALLIKNKSQHVTIKNAVFSSPKYTGYTTGDMDAIICADGDDVAFANNDYLTIDNCTITGSKYGIRIDGTGYVALPKQEGAVIRNCQIKDFAFGGIYMTKERNYTIEDNTILNNGSLDTNSKCIDAVSMPGSVIRNNVLEIESSKYASAIYLRARDTNETLETMNIYNNSINFITTVGSSYAINATDALKNINIVYNTVLMKGDASNSACFWSDIDASLKGVVLQNNIFQNKAGGYAVRLQKESGLTSGEITFNHNVYYSSATNHLFKTGSTEYANLTLWQAVSNDAGSQRMETTFLSDKVLDLLDNTSLIEAMPLNYVTTDINGRERGTSSTPGAYQFNIADNTAPVLLSGYPMITNLNSTSATIKLKTDNNGNAYIIVQEVSEVAPDAATLQSNGQKIELKKNAETSYTATNLTAQKNYKAYILMVSLRDKKSPVVVSDPFITAIQPTAVSTFENVVDDETHFISGTAEFNHFSIVSRTEHDENNLKAAQIDEGATVLLTNSSTGLELTGFYLKSAVEVTLQVYETLAATEAQTTVIPATTTWTFINLKDLGKIAKIKFSKVSQGIALIDNFSGQPMPLTINAQDISTDENETVTLNSQVEGGVEPYQYEWTNAKHEVIGSSSTCDITAICTSHFTVTVTDAWGNIVTARNVVNVTGDLHVADFENLYLSEESHWGGPFEKTNEFMINSQFYSGSFAFKNYCMPSLYTWAFFGYSNETSTDFSIDDFFEQQFRSTVGHGVNESSNYGVVYCEKTMGHTDLRFTHTQEGAKLSGMYVTANAYLKSCVLEGDGMSKESDGTTGKPFAIGDSVAIKATGYFKDQIVGVVTFPLADYRSNNVNEHYILDSWQWMDLSSLGKIDKVRFSMTSTKQNAKGITTPAYFCIDNVGDVRPEIVLAQEVMKNNEVMLNLSTLCAMQGEGTTQYQIVTQPNAAIATARLENNQLKVKTIAIGETSVWVMAMNRGCRKYYQIPLKTTTTVGIQDVMTQSYIQKKGAEVCFVTTMNDYKATLLTATGRIIWSSSFNSGTITLPLNDALHGVYLLRIEGNGGLKTFKFTR